MTSPGSSPRRGFLAKLQSMSVVALPVDDGQPIVRPRGVTIASVLAIIAGVVFLFAGVLGYAQTNAALDYAVNQNQISRTGCINGPVGAFGSTVATPTEASLTSTAAACRGLQVPTQADKDGFKTTQHVFGVIFALLGVVFGAAGWFLREGRKWAKRVLVIGGAVLLVAAALLKLSTPITLLGTLILAIAVVMTYIGKNSVYFMRVAMRGKQH